MRIAVPREVQDSEGRVAITPSGVHELVQHGHEVAVQSGAGAGASISDDDFAAAGATVLPDAADTWAFGDLVLKVKDPTPAEFDYLRAGQILFAFLHLAADKRLTVELMRRKVTALAYETVELADGSLPLLAPMSEVAGRLAPQVGAYSLMSAQGGRGLLLGGVSGVYSARVVVIGAGVAGMNAATMAIGMQADVLLMDRDVSRLRHADAIHRGRCQTVASNSFEIERAIISADLVIGAVLLPGARTPRLVSNEQIAKMKPGSVVVDISVDQGGCFADSRPTTHSEPTYQVHDTLFYCVTNMPGAVANTSTYALTNLTVPYVLQIAEQGWREALLSSQPLARGLATHDGVLLSGPVAEAHDLPVGGLTDVLG